MFKTPIVRIGGVNIHQQNFRWALTAGATPFEASFLVPVNVSEQLSALKNPTFIEIEAFGGCDGTPRQLKRRFNNIYLLEPNKIDPFHVMWKVADVRYTWRGKRIFDVFNKTRVKNQKGVATVAPETSPNILREQFDFFQIGRYIPWSVKKNGKPYSVYEMLNKILTDNGIKFKANKTGALGSYILENIDMNGRDFYTGISYLLALSRLQMGIDRAGNVYVYSVDYLDAAGTNLIEKFKGIPRVTPGVFFKQDLKKERPKKIHVCFEKKIETWLVNGTSSAGSYSDNGRTKPIEVSALAGVRTAEDIKKLRVLGIENVIPIPYPIQIAGAWKNVGEWVTMNQYLDAIGISDADLRAYFFAGRMERWFAHSMELMPNESNERFLHHIISTIKMHYRQTWQIDPYYMDRIEKWEPRRVDVINNLDHYTPPSPVFSNFCYIPTVRQPDLAKRVGAWQKNAYNWDVNTHDATREKPTGATINIVNQALGIFSIVLPPNLNGDSIVRTFPFCLNPLPYPSLSSAPYLLEECQIVQSHIFETIVSIVWAVDEKEKVEGKYRKISYSPKNAEGPEVTMVCQEEYARYPIKANDACSNDAIVTAIANVYSVRALNSYKDRFTGICTFAGFIETQIVGAINGISYAFDSTGLTTTVDARNLPGAPTLEQGLKQQHIDFLRRHITRGDEASEAQK